MTIELDERADATASASMTDSNRRRHARTFEEYKFWCRKNHPGHPPHRTSALALRAWLQHLHEQRAPDGKLRYRADSLRKFKDGVIAHQVEEQKRILRNNPILTEWFAGVKVKLAQAGSRTNRTDPMRIKHIIRLMRAMWPDPANDPLHCRNRAIVLLGFFGCFRCNEISAIRTTDMEFKRNDDGHITGLTISYGISKTNRGERDEFKTVPVLELAEFCPVLAVQSWLAQRNESSPFLFPSPVREGAPLSPGQISDMVTHAAIKCGITGPDSNITGHSLHSGGMNAMNEMGRNAFEIMELSGHTRVETVQRYIKRESDALKSPMAGVDRLLRKAGA